MVVDSGSIAKAADRDLNRQSLISRQIRELEEFFNIELTFEKRKGDRGNGVGSEAGVINTLSSWRPGGFYHRGER